MSTINLKLRHQLIGGINEQRYVTAPVRYSNISSDELIKYASEASGIAKAQMAASFYAIAQQMEFFILNGHGLVLGNLGNFYLSLDTKATTTEEAAGASAVKRICVRFRQSKKLQTLLNSSVTLNTLKKPTTSSTGSSSGGSGSDAGSDTGSDSGSDSGSENPYDPFAS